MNASAIPGRVPLGFICGYPLAAGGELYGGSMFIASAANDTLQGRAIHAINEKWGTNFQNWTGRETIGIPVCKKKYAPFDFRKRTDSDGKIRVEVVRMYGCACHSHLRESVIQRHGERKGWEPFGQWSMKKAQALAKKTAEKLNTVYSGDEKEQEDACPMTETLTSSSSCSLSSDSHDLHLAWKRLCHNGKCAWKLKHKYDDVVSEIHEKNQAG